ncbi:MAG TPA: hypothetical protein VGK73_07570 [Polyangiaceae bacterium]
MSPLVRAGVLAALLSALGVALARAPRTVRIGSSGARAPASGATASRGPAAPCPRGTLPDAEICVPVPAAPAASAPERSQQR